RATMSAIRHPCLIMGQCPSNFEGRNTFYYELGLGGFQIEDTVVVTEDGAERFNELPYALTIVPLSNT
ncbi:MAG: hypothetical protein BECKG1743D_GA0114223_108093, partial [Candidatus Kentron sp. G]